MSERTSSPGTTLKTIAVDGVRVRVVLRVAHDGIEYVGRLCFRPDTADAEEDADRGALPGRDVDDVFARVEALSDAELQQRYQRALAERRRFRALRSTTVEILAKICRLNEIALSMKEGLVEAEGAADDLLATEKSLHALVDGLRTVAGVESDAN
jgi:hypothetical protein